MKLPGVFGPLRHRDFRLLWAGMGASYAGDRLQELAQSWLVAVLTRSSAMAVGWISVIASVPQLFMPVGGALAERVNRRKLLILGQVAGALAAGVVGLLVVTGRILPGHIYAWAFLNGLIWLVSRPAFKVVLTESVPVEQVRPAVALNSMAETAIMVTTAAAGSLLLEQAGLGIAFLLNAISYLVAAWSLGRLTNLDHRTEAQPAQQTVKELALSLREGFTYLAHQPKLFHPLLLTLAMVIGLTPAFGLLAAILHAQGKSIISLGLLGAAASVGSLTGAIYAGSHSESQSPTRQYAWLALAGAAAMALFIVIPIGPLTALPLAVNGFIAFSQAVWNTSRVRLLAHPAYQARLQALTTMAFTMGGALGQLWGGIAVDHFGVKGLFTGVALLALVSISCLASRRYASDETRQQV